MGWSQEQHPASLTGSGWLSQMPARPDSLTLTLYRADFRHNPVQTKNCVEPVAEAYGRIDKRQENGVGLNWRRESQGCIL